MLIWLLWCFATAGFLSLGLAGLFSMKECV